MSIFRCTEKLLALVGRPDPQTDGLAPAGDDWYANVIRVDGRKCLLVTHAGTLFSMFVADVRAADLRPLGALVVPVIAGGLSAEGLHPESLGTLDPAAVLIAKTADRRVVGCMNDLAITCEAAAAGDGGLARLDLADLHHRLHRNLNSTRGYVPAIDLAAQWARRPATG